MDLFCKSMDWYCIVITNPDSKKVWFVPYEMNPGFIKYRVSRILTLKDSFQIVNHKSSQFSKICLFLRIQQILSTIAQKESLKIQICKSLRLGLANPDLWIQTLKICIADLIRRPFFERFLRPKISNYLNCFDSEGFVYNSCILRIETWNKLLFLSHIVIL
jgi:hypothetical protein